MQTKQTESRDLQRVRTRLLVSSADRLNGRPDHFVVPVNIAEFGNAQASGPIEMSIDFVSPIYLSTSTALNYFDAIEICFDNLPQHRSYSTELGTSTRTISLIPRDHGLVQTSLNADDYDGIQGWTMTQQHSPMTLSADVLHVKLWNIRLKFADTRQANTITEAVAARGETVTIKDWTMIVTLEIGS